MIGNPPMGRNSTLRSNVFIKLPHGNLERERGEGALAPGEVASVRRGRRVAVLVVAHDREGERLVVVVEVELARVLLAP